MAAANVVEIVVKATDDTAGGFAGAKAGAESAGEGMDAYAAAQDRVTEAEMKLRDAQIQQADAQLRLEEYQKSGTASADEIAAAQDKVAAAAGRAADAQIRLGKADADLAGAQQAAANSATEEAAQQDASVSKKSAAQAKLTAQSRAYDAAMAEQMEAQRALIAVNADVAAGADVSAADQAAALSRVEKAEAAVAVRSKEMAATTEESSASMSGALSKFGMIGSMALAGIGYESIKMATSFQQATERLVTQAGVPQKELGALRSGILGLAGAVGFSPDSLAESLYHVASNMASLGATAPQMMDAVKIAAEGAKVGGANLEDVTNSLTAAIASGIPGVQNYSQAMGALNAIVGAGDMKMQDLSEAMGSGLMAVVKGYGLSLKDVGAALDVFGDNNIRGAHAATDLRMAVQALAVPATAGKAQLAGMGLSMTSLADTMRKGGLLAALEELQSRFKKAGITAAEQGEAITNIFGKKAGVGLAVLMDQMDRLKSKYPDITKGADNFGKAWAATQQTTGQRLDELRATFESLGTAIGMKLLPAISSFAGFLDRNKAVLQALAPIILAIVAAMTAWAGVMKVIEILSDLSPWTIAIMAVIAVVVLLVEHWKTVEKVAKDVWHAVEDATDAAREAIMTAFNAVKGAVTDVVDFVKDHWKLLATIFLAVAMGPLGLVVGLFIDNFAKIKHAVLDVLDWAQSHWKLLAAIILGPLGLIIDALVTHWKAVEDGFRTAYDFVAGVVRDAIGIIEDIVKPYIAWSEAIFRALWDVVKAVFQVAWDVISGIVRTEIDVIKVELSWFEKLAGLFRGWWDDAVRAVSSEIDKLVGYVEKIPGRINSALGGLPGMMFKAGVHVIESLLSGITSMIGNIGSTMGNIASKVAGFFGLSPAKEGPLSGGGAPEIRGAHFAEAFAQGMLSRQGAIGSAAQRLAGTAGMGAGSASGGAGGGAAGAPQPIQLTVSGGTGLDQLFMTWLKNNVRASGGDPRIFNRKVQFL